MKDMMTKSILCSSLAASLLLLTGCGQSKSETPAKQAEAATESKPAPASAAEPEVTPAQATETTSTESATQAKMVDGYEELVWEDMMPEGEEERLMKMYADMQTSLYGMGAIQEGSAEDKAIQIGTFNVVDELDGLKIRLPGYTVPLEYSEEVSEFLLVPYFGACLHAPPPPPNQTLYVKSDKPIKMGDLAQAVWVYGTLHTETQNSDLADTAYTLTLDKIEEYQY